MILSLISQKGGVGKSAVARLLAVEFTKAGWSVKIADLDPAQGTSAKWKARRDRAGIQPEIAVEKFRTLDRALKEADRFDLVILDGPAHAEQGGRIMARESDLVLCRLATASMIWRRRLRRLTNWNRVGSIPRKNLVRILSGQGIGCRGPGGSCLPTEG